jgi:hypothetical protein
MTKRCRFKDCQSVNPSFDLPGGNGKFCKEHKESNMINVIHVKCYEKECNIIANFGYIGKLEKYCKKHRKNDMIDLVHKKCENILCNKIPNYNFFGNKAKFCFEHREIGMIDVINKRCKETGCDSISPCFDFPGEKGRYCSKHKKEGMINIKDKRCEESECDSITPCFDFPGEKGRYCSKHKKEGMIDVKHKICEEEGCDTLSLQYGKPGKPPSHCVKHRKEGMIKRPNSKCKLCDEKAIYGINLTALHCEIHKDKKDTNLCERECESCNLNFILNEYNLCEFCDPIIIEKAKFVKQNTLMKYLDSKDLKGDFTDIVIDKGECGKERPDRVFDFDDKIIILECDENQHKERNCVCEQTRMINISQSFGGIPIYFLRWNPDKYKSKNKEETMIKRYTTLENLIKNIKNNVLELHKSLCSVMYLYYDGWTSLKEEKWEILLQYD